MCQILNSFQGIIGAVIGTILGWGLSELSRIGKLTFYVDNITIEYFESDNGGSFYKNNFNDKTDYGIILFESDIINNSNKNRILRNIYCAISYSNDRLSKEISNVESKRLVAQKYEYDRLEIMNIQAKSIIKKKLSVYLSKDELSKFFSNNSKISFSFMKFWGIKKQKDIFITYLQNDKIK